MGASVGRSSYGELNGVEQFVADQFVADQVASLAWEFDTQYPSAFERGDRLTVNEGIRSRERQRILRAAWLAYLAGGPWAALAAALYLSTHDESRGSGLDFGIRMADGRNRAMTPDEAAWVHAHGVARGIRWTGAGFVPQEVWHHNGGFPWTVPPIVGVNRPGEPFFHITPAPTPEEDEDDMQIKLMQYQEKPEVFAYADGSPLWMHVSETIRDRIMKRFNVQVEVVDGKTFELTKQLAENVARGIWSYELEDKGGKQQRTSGSFLQTVLDYARKAAR